MYPAPRRFPAHFFSNNPALEQQATRKGWRFHYVHEPLTDDIVVSSLQSKRVKFLQLREATPYTEIIYADHKHLITDRHIEQLKALKTHPVLLRDNHKRKTSVWDEVADSLSQERYRKHMTATEEYIRAKVAAGYSEQARVGATGLIGYSMTPRVLELADAVYRDLCAVGTPQCQIIWAMAAQPYADLIQQIAWDAVPISWKRPSRSALALHYLNNPLALIRTLRRGTSEDTWNRTTSASPPVPD